MEVFSDPAQEDEDAVPVELGAGEASTWAVEALTKNPEPQILNQS